MKMFTKEVIKHISTTASLLLKIARSVSQFFDIKYWLIKTNIGSNVF